MDARFVDRHGAAIGDFGPGIDIVIQRFGDEAVPVAHRRGIERRRLAIGGVADAVERLAVGEGRGEAQVDAAEHVLREAFDEAHHFRHGSDRRLTHTELQSEQEDKIRLEADLRAAIASKQFHLVYQPLVSARDQKLVGFEALIRWNHPQRGFIPPPVFINLAEECGLMMQLGEWVIEEACRGIGLPAPEGGTTIDAARRRLEAMGVRFVPAAAFA